MEVENQTGVEWLINQFMTHPLPQSKEEFEVGDWKAKFEHAKKMDLKQKLECWNAAHQAGRFEGKGIAEENWQTFDQYYKDSYKSNP